MGEETTPVLVKPTAPSGENDNQMRRMWIPMLLVPIGMIVVAIILIVVKKYRKGRYMTMSGVQSYLPFQQIDDCELTQTTQTIPECSQLSSLGSMEIQLSKEVGQNNGTKQPDQMN
jgi:hypothetical protein